MSLDKSFRQLALDALIAQCCFYVAGLRHGDVSAISSDEPLALAEVVALINQLQLDNDIKIPQIETTATIAAIANAALLAKHHPPGS